MLLTQQDIQTLRKMGNKDRDIAQIQTAIFCTTYKNEQGKRISRAKAIEILGRKGWLAGLSRSAFHWTCSAFNGTTNATVYLDSSRLFK